MSMADSNDRLREARAKAGFPSARQAALRFGWNPSTYSSHENGQTPVPPKAAESYAPKLGTSAAWILFGTGPDTVPAAQTIRPGGPEVSDVQKVGEGWPDLGDEWIDVRGVTVGGDDSFFYMGDTIDQVRRPRGLKNAKNVAALNVAGESMVPRFKAGELLYVQDRFAAPGDDVVVEMHPEHEGEAPKSFLKELVRRTGSRLYCRQHNPPADIEFNMAEVKTVWRVLTLRDLMG